MPDPSPENRSLRLAEELNKLPDVLLSALERLALRFQRPEITLPQGHTSVFPVGFAEHLGVDLCLHHCFTDEPFKKDKFEYSAVRITRACGGAAAKAPAGLAGYDVIINGVKVSLKSEAAQSIKEDEIHVSKFMELGKGVWGDKEEHLHEKRDQFVRHLGGYDRIFTLRCLNPTSGDTWRYELVEIPKCVLLRAEKGTFEMMRESAQKTALPGYCRVFDDVGERIFELYFDGGSERKLQIKHLRKEGYCPVIATWEFGREA